MDNVENILDELNDFDKHKTAEIPKALEEYINHLAKTGDTVFPWQKIRGVIRHKLELVINNFKEICPTENLPPCPNVESFNYDTMHDKIFEQFDSFTCAPFTIQRLCELLCAPRKHYKRTDKFMRGIEKNLLVVSTVDPGQRKRSESVSSQSLVNGVIESNTATNRAAAAVSTTTNNRPSSVASDAVSISDADSGISDTEDEEKSSGKAAELAVETNGKHEEAPEKSGPEPVLEMTESSTGANETEHPAPDTQAEKSVALDESKPEEEVAPVTSLNEDAPVSDEHVPTKPEEPTVPTEAAKPSAGSETPISDKKRPLEDDEDDQEPGAKQPRMHSPDKAVEEVQPVLAETEATPNDESPAAEQELAGHNTPDDEQAPPAQSDCQ